MSRLNEGARERSEYEQMISPEVQRAGALLVRVGDEVRDTFWNTGEIEVAEKESQHSIVTPADLFSQAHIVEELGNIFPESVVMPEEKSQEEREAILARAFAEGQGIIHVDPADGTSFLTAGLADWSLSAAGPDWGITYAPAHQDRRGKGTLFVAQAQKGFYENGVRRYGSKESELKNVIGNFSHRDIRTPETYNGFVGDLLRDVRSLWATGSTAYALAQVAAGRVGFAIHPKQSYWDFAAARVMLQEAEGKLTDIDGRADRFDMSGARVPQNTIVAATNPTLHGIVFNRVRQGMSR